MIKDIICVCGDIARVVFMTVSQDIIEVIYIYHLNCRLHEAFLFLVLFNLKFICHQFFNNLFI